MDDQGMENDQVKRTYCILLVTYNIMMIESNNY